MMYTGEHYKSKLLIQEKVLIVKALTKTNGVVKAAHGMLCPNDRPYTLNALQIRLKRHGIKSKEFKSKKEIT